LGRCSPQTQCETWNNEEINFINIIHSSSSVSIQAKGFLLPVTDNPNDYVAGDIVSWMLPGNLPHIGIVIDSRSVEKGKPLIVHNIGSGPVIEDILFDYQITGHYRYYGKLK
jgi:uncharacterized protein YijF (DUF1287 family)